MANRQPWAALSRAFELNPSTEGSIDYVLDFVLLTRAPRDIYRVYDYLLELFTQGPVLPNYIHVIYRHFHRNNVYRIRYSSLYDYRWRSRFGERIFSTLERKAPDLYRDVFSDADGASLDVETRGSAGLWCLVCGVRFRANMNV